MVNTVKFEGYMGNGIEYQFKLKYPQNDKDYVCKLDQLNVGTMYCFVEECLIMINFLTKNKWRQVKIKLYIR